MALADITHLTLDCYGTLIDWETGILNALEPLLASLPIARRPNSQTVLSRFAFHEARVETLAWRPYREVLNEVLRALAADFGWRARDNETSLLADSLPHWPPFADTNHALQRLSSRFKLVILSNTDDALFAATARQMHVAFNDVITAEQVCSYKPAPAHFNEALRRLTITPIQVLHVAQSLYHDHVPAKRLGWRTLWVRRPSLLAATGLAPVAEATPDFTCGSLSEVADLLARTSD
jgi:2-haloacid dehalogenase